MKLSVLSGLLLAAVLLAQQSDSGPTFRTNTNLVVVNVSVKDKNGKPLAGLKKEDFRMLENGKEQQIAVFTYETLTGTSTAPDAVQTELKQRPDPVPTAGSVATGSQRFRDRRLMVLFFDLTSLPAPDQLRAVEAATKFIKEQLTPSDMVQVMSFANKLRVDQEFTEDRDLLLRALGRFRLGEGSELAAEGTTPDPDGDDPNGGFSADDTEFNIFNTDRKLSALESVARSLAPLPEKKALIYFSSGVSKTGVENQSQLRSTVNAAVRSNVSIYAIDVRGLTAMPPGADATQSSPRGTGIYTGATQGRQRDKFNDSQETLDTLASDTGGKALLDNNDLTVGMRQAQNDIQSYYLLGYYSTNQANDGKFRRVEVKLASNIQAKIDYRAGYYGQKQFAKFTSSDKEKQLEEALLLGDPHTELPLALEVNYFRLNKARYFVPVAVKIPGSEIPLAKKGGADATSFDFIGQIRDAKGALVANLRDNVPIKLPTGDSAQLARRSLLYDTGFTLPPGVFTLKMLARENQTGKMGTFETKFTIPDVASEKDKLPLSSVVWSSQREPIQAAVGSADKSKKQFDNHPLVQDGQKLIPSITHVFRRNQSLYVYLEAYDPGTDQNAKAASVAATVSLYQGGRKAFESAPVHLNRIAAQRPGAVPVELQVPLASLQPGDYICQVNVIDEIGKRFAFPRSKLVVLP